MAARQRCTICNDLTPPKNLSDITVGPHVIHRVCERCKHQAKFFEFLFQLRPTY